YTYTTNINATESRLAYQQYNVSADGGIEASGSLKPFSTDRIRFDNFSVRGHGMDLKASGVFPNGARLEGTADLSQLPVTGMEIGGRARVQASVSGSLQNP